MRIITCEEVSANAADRWVNQYKGYDQKRPMPFTGQLTLGEYTKNITDAPRTPDGVSGAIGQSWAYPRCDACYAMCRAVAVYREDDEGEFSICDRCAGAVCSALSSLNK